MFAWAVVGCGLVAETDGTVCKNDGDPNGPTCLQAIETDADFERIALVGEKTASTKYMLPAINDSSLLPLVFQNIRRWDLHIEFLRAAFPDLFGDLTTSQYLKMIYNRDNRTYFSGVVQRRDDTGAGRMYGFNVWVDLSDPSEQLEMPEIRKIYDRIHAVFLPEKLVYLPTDLPAIQKARSWVAPDFPLYLGWQDTVTTEVYTAGACYGQVRCYTLEELDAAMRRGNLGWRDVVVVDRVPFDIESVVAGVVTGGRQWELSHVNVRMARRGTPNLFAKDALSKFADLDGRLVRLEAIRSAFSSENDRYNVTEATQDEAEAWWSAHRPNLGSAPPIDESYTALDNLLDMNTDDDPVPLIERVGGKAANLAKLYSFLPPARQVPAFAVPFKYFLDFMEDNALTDARGDTPEVVTYREYVRRLSVDERFHSDAPYRRLILWDLRTRMRTSGRVDPKLPAALAERIEQVFGDPLVKVRFRSSSNVEDALEFSGAGLYSSTSVCAADSLDGDMDGPSLCDAEKDEERTIERGLTRVWASLYNYKAWEEREWYQVPHDQAAMAILVSKAFSGEIANGVAFTGNPSRSDDDRFLLNAQAGDVPVVGCDPLLVPERDLLAFSAAGVLEEIHRDRSSVLAEPGTYVLDDARLADLGALLFDINRNYPLDTGSYRRDQVLLDLEFKIDREGVLKIKQIRPFLDKCRHVECREPPDDFCRDAGTLVHFNFYGRCDTQTGECRYDSTDEACANGCADGSCIEQ